MKLPNGHQALLGTKVEDFCLNVNHIYGRTHAEQFKRELGIDLSNKEILKEALLKAAKEEEVVDEKRYQYANGYILEFLLQTKDNAKIVLSAWAIRDGEDFPRLVTAYPKSGYE